MSGTRTADRPRCSVCYRRDSFDYRHTIDGERRGITWHNIQFVRKAGDSVILRCANCGHEYRSRGKAGRKLAKQVIP